MRIEVLLLAQLTKQHADLVRQLRDSVIAGLLPPVGELCRNREALFTSGFVGADKAVLSFDELKEFLRQLRLAGSAQTRESETTARTLRTALVLLSAGADGECFIPAARY